MIWAENRLLNNVFEMFLILILSKWQIIRKIMTLHLQTKYDGTEKIYYTHITFFKNIKNTFANLKMSRIIKSGGNRINIMWESQK